MLEPQALSEASERTQLSAAAGGITYSSIERPLRVEDVQALDIDRDVELTAPMADTLAKANRGLAGQTSFETNSTDIVRTMFVLYSLLIVGGVVFFVTVGLTQQ